MTKLKNTSITLKKKTLFSFRASQGAKRGTSTDPITLTATISYGFTDFTFTQK